MTSDHAVFKRLTRQQLIIRRRSVGVQALIFMTSVEPKWCRRCGRSFNATWKALLCHICGLWACLSCSHVIERERDMYVIRFVRACVPCMNLVNKWPDPGLLADIIATPWITQSDNCQVGINLADALRSTPHWRRAVVTLLRHFGQPAIDDELTLLDEIGERDWMSMTNHLHDDPQTGGSINNISSSSLVVELPTQSTAAFATATSTNDKATPSGGTTEIHRLSRRVDHHRRRELAHLLVQQCFDVSIKELPLAECVFAEADGKRGYPILYDEVTEAPSHSPIIATEAERVKYIEYYGLTACSTNGSLEMQLLCDLASKELDALTAYISVIHGETHQSVSCRPQSPNVIGTCGVFSKRSQTMCAHALVVRDRPFLVRDAALDFRFRNLGAVAGDASVRFYLGVPILSDLGVPIATLTILDTSPRRQITTMQYSVVRLICATIARIWEEQHGVIV